jgi:transcription elongation factor Elf1
VTEALSESFRDIFGLMNRFAAARKKLHKRPGEILRLSANCPRCGGHQTVVIASDGKRMMRIACSTANCLKALG